MRALALTLLLACDPPAETDAATYSRVLSTPSLSSDACAPIRDPSLKGDCLLVVATRAPDPAAACPDLPAGVWQEECWFVAAEAINRQGDALGAAALCQKAGRFRLDCAQHLWQTPVHQLIHARGAQGFAEAMPQAEALYAAWAPVVAGQSDFEQRFWAKFFGNGFEGQGTPISARWCEPVPEPRRAACLSAAGAHLSRELGPAVEQPGRLQPFCAMWLPGVAEIAAWLPAEPDAALDAAVLRSQLDICTNAPGAPGTVGGRSACVSRCMGAALAFAGDPEAAGEVCEIDCAPD